MFECFFILVLNPITQKKNQGVRILAQDQIIKLNT